MNKSLRQYYEKIGTTFGLEDIAFDRGVENAYGLYGDVAIVVLSRGGGEGSDMPTVTEEEADEKDLASHTGYVTQADGKVYKHFLQLTDSEEALLDYVKAQGFKKIIYLVNSSEISRWLTFRMMMRLTVSCGLAVQVRPVRLVRRES